MSTIEPFHRGRERRGLRSFWRYIRDAPGFGFRAASAATFVAATCIDGHADQAITGLPIAFLIVIPLTYLWWRRAGPT